MSGNSSPYHEAGWLLNEHLEKRRGLKSIAFDSARRRNGKKKGGGGVPDKAVYATVCKTVQHLPAIDAVLDANDMRLRRAVGFDSVRNRGLLYVCVHELLFGKYRSIRGGGKVKRMIVKHEKELRRAAEEYVSKHGVGAGGELFGGEATSFPRYVRVNTLRCPDVAKIVERLRGDLCSKATEDAAPADQSDGTKEMIDPNTTIYGDAHVPDLLVLPPSASSLLHRDHDLVKSGKVVLQDKSSCFSALALIRGARSGEDDAEEENKNAGGRSFDYIDACAAPGNKTSHLAALVRSSLSKDGDADAARSKKKRKGGKAKAGGPKSTIFAFERSSTRFKILEERMELLAPPPSSEDGDAVSVVPIHGDFLRADPSDPMFANVRAVMLDPSCSGSGIVNSPDRRTDEAGGGGGNKKEEERIRSLSNFQLVALKHAMSFPNVERIVYSTCSVHEEENEGVVGRALSESAAEGVDGNDDGNGWELVAPACLDGWARRGKEGGIGGLTKDRAERLVRCDGLDGDETNGFFVAFLVRKRAGWSAGQGTMPKAAAIEREGIPTYDGQFRDVVKKGIGVAKDRDEAPEEGDSEEPSARRAVGPAEDQKRTARTTKVSPAPKKVTADKRSAKKREKKLAWKRRQASQKSQRLKKKEVSAKAASGGEK